MIIDRFEGNLAICEDNGTYISIQKHLLPQGAIEGSSIQLTSTGYILLDNSDRQAAMRSKMMGLFNK